MLSKRNYKITPKTVGLSEYNTGCHWLKVEMWNDFGMKCTVYEKNVMDASKVIINWWESSEKEFDKQNLLSKAIKQCNNIDKSSGILTGNYDGLD